MTVLEILSIAPTATVQDRGRIGWLRYGVTGSGAMDAYALAEGQALLGNGPDAAALEFAAFGGRFKVAGGGVFATSGAAMELKINGTRADWRRSHALRDGDILEIGAANDGVYGYLHGPGGFQTETVMGARATHRRAAIGHVLAAGQVLPCGAGTVSAPMALPRTAYFDQRVIRILWGPQSHLFSDAVRSSFARSRFVVTNMRDRMGIQVTPDSGPVVAEGGRSIASDTVNLGDIQITGDGTPAILLADRGSSGGYPRIATVITADLGALAQIPAGESFAVDVVDRPAALIALAAMQKAVKELPAKRKPVLRDPRDMADLLAYNLIDGVLRGDEHDND